MGVTASMFTGTIGHLVAAMIVFLLSHGLPARPNWRATGTRRLGEVGYVIAYSIMSLAVVVWLGFAYADAPYIEVWPYQPGLRWVTLVAMLASCILIVAGFATPNPFSLGPGGRGYDPARPGILRLTRHPVLWGLALWAGGHIPPNGDVASLILFGPLLILALAGPALMERKRRRTLGAAEWARLAAPTSRPATVRLSEVGIGRLAGGVALYLVLILLHPYVIGIDPLVF